LPSSAARWGSGSAYISLYSYSVSTDSALLWLLLAIADFSQREDDTGIPESGTIPPCHRDASTPLESWSTNERSTSTGRA
jgi:hypothetical protein